MNKLFCIIAASTLLFLTSTVFAQTQEHNSTNRFVEATGTAEVKIPATKVSVSLTITKSAVDAKSALKENSVIADKVIQALKSESSVSDLQTDTVQLYERKKYDNIRNESVTTGYESRNQISFTVDLKSAGEVIDNSIKLGANNVLSVSPKAEDSAIESAKLQAIELATKKAKTTAERSLTALGFAAKDVQMIRVDPEQTYFPGPQPLMEGVAMERSFKASSTPIEGGTNSVTARVLIRMIY